MTQWIQSSNTKQDGTPVTRAIKIPEMSEEIWFTTNAYAEVSQTVGDLLANQLESISKVSKPASPGTYYGDAGSNTTVQLVLADKSFNDLSVTGTADIAVSDTDVTAADTSFSGQSLGNTETANRRTTLPIPEIGDTWTEVDGAIIASDYRYPTIVHAGRWFDNPLGEWYIYAGIYDTPEIDLFYADEITGPYTQHGTVISAEPSENNNDSPHAVVDERSGELKVYYHGEAGDFATGAQYSLLATTPLTGDGTTFSKYTGDNSAPTPILDGEMDGRWDERVRTYLSVQKLNGLFVGVYQGQDDQGNDTGFGIAWSHDGIEWETARRPIGWSGQLGANNPQRRLFGAPSLIRFGDELVVLYNEYRQGRNAQLTYAIGWDQLTGDLLHSEVTELLEVSTGMVEQSDTVSVPSEDRTYLVWDEYIGYFDWGDL